MQIITEAEEMQLISTIADCVISKFPKQEKWSTVFRLFITITERSQAAPKLWNVLLHRFWSPECVFSGFQNLKSVYIKKISALYKSHSFLQFLVHFWNFSLEEGPPPPIFCFGIPRSAFGEISLQLW